MSETKRTIAGVEWVPSGYPTGDWLTNHNGVSGCAFTARRYIPVVAHEEIIWIARLTIRHGSRDTMLSVRGFKTMRGAALKLVTLARKMGANV